MKMLEEFIDKLNFKKAFITYIIISGVSVLLCLSVLAYVSRDKIAMVMDFQKASDRYRNEGVTHRLEAQLQDLVSDSKDINNVLVLNKNNAVVFKANRNLIGEKTKLELIPYGIGSGYLQDRTNPYHLFKVENQENLILDYIPYDLQLRQVINDEMSYEIDFSNKEIYLLNYLMDRNTKSKVLLIRNAAPIPFSERLIELTGTLLGLIIVIYWVGLALWVYKDAGKKKLNASLWGLLILITNLAGLIVYLIYKQNNQTCFNCGALQSKFSSFCSYCGTEINESCSNCKALLSKGAIHCSKCGSKIEYK